MIVFKIIGSIIVICTSSLLGFVYARECAKRPSQLRNLQGMLQVFENEVVYLSNVLTEAFLRIHRRTDCVCAEFFLKTVQNLEIDSGMNAAKAWEASVRENIKKTALSKEDEEILISFGKMLGSSDVEGQIKNIGLTLKQLKIQEQKAEAYRNKNEKMYRNLGILGGLAIVILFF